jgi:hypothetical protein
MHVRLDSLDDLIVQVLDYALSAALCYIAATYPHVRAIRSPQGVTMQMHHLNWLAALVAAISAIVTGFLWYSPILFAKPWMREMGYDFNDKVKVKEMQKSAGPAYFASFIASFVSAFILALFFHWLRVQDIQQGLGVAFHVWLGFVATVQLTGALFMKQSMKLFAINTGYQLVCYLLMGAILAAWR